MDAIRQPRDQPLADLEAGPVDAGTNPQTESSEIETVPKVEDTGPPPPGIQECRIRECQCFPDGETKEQCQERFKAYAEEQKNSYGIDKICIWHVELT
jgi:hypothetical protein